MSQPRDLEYELELKDRQRRRVVKELRNTIDQRDKEIRSLKDEIASLNYKISRMYDSYPPGNHMRFKHS